MAKLTGKHWYDCLNWVAEDKNDVITIYGHHFPNVHVIASVMFPDRPNKVIRWKNKDADTIHEFALEPDWMYDDPTTQIQALLVAIKLS